MLKRLAMLFAVVTAMLTGCAGGTNVISDADLASAAGYATKNASYYGLKAVFANNPGRVPQLSADITIATGAVRKNLVQLFTDPSLGNVLDGAVDTLLVNLSSELDKLPNGSLIANLIQGGWLALKMVVHLPENPAATLDERTKGALVAGLTGLADGLDQAVKDFTPPSPTAKRLPVKLVR